MKSAEDPAWLVGQWTNWVIKALAATDIPRQRIAEQADINPSYLSLMCRGTIPRRQVVQALGKVLGKEEEALLMAGYVPHRGFVGLQPGQETDRNEPTLRPDLDSHPWLEEPIHTVDPNSSTTEGSSESTGDSALNQSISEKSTKQVPPSEILVGRIKLLLQTKKHDYKPHKLWEEYTATHKDGTTERQIHEVLLLNPLFARTRSGHFQLANFGKTIQTQSIMRTWEPKGPIDWMLAIASEISQTTNYSAYDQEIEELLFLLTSVVEHSEAEAKSSKGYIQRLWHLPLVKGIWTGASSKLPAALANLVVLAGVKVAAADQSPSTEEQRVLTRICTALGVSKDKLANYLDGFAHKPKHQTSHEQHYLALELPESKRLEIAMKSHASLSILYRHEHFESFGADYILFAEKRLIRMGSAILALSPREKAKPEPSPERETLSLAPPGTVTLKQACGNFGITPNEIYELSKANPMLKLRRVESKVAGPDFDRTFVVVNEADLARILKVTRKISVEKGPADTQPLNVKASKQKTITPSDRALPASSPSGGAAEQWARVNSQASQTNEPSEEIYYDLKNDAIFTTSGKKSRPEHIRYLITIPQAASVFQVPVFRLYTACENRELKVRAFKAFVEPNTRDESLKLPLLDSREVESWSICNAELGQNDLKEQEESNPSVSLRSKPFREIKSRQATINKEIYFGPDGEPLEFSNLDLLQTQTWRTFEQVSSTFGVPVADLYLSVDRGDLTVVGYKSKHGKSASKHRLLDVRAVEEWLQDPPPWTTDSRRNLGSNKRSFTQGLTPEVQLAKGGDSLHLVDSGQSQGRNTMDNSKAASSKVGTETKASAFGMSIVRKAVVNLYMSVILADGLVKQSKLNALIGYFAKSSLMDDHFRSEINALVAEAQEIELADSLPDVMAFLSFQAAEVRAELYSTCVEIAFADDDLVDEEREILSTIAAVFQIASTYQESQFEIHKRLSDARLKEYRERREGRYTQESRVEFSADK